MANELYRYTDPDDASVSLTFDSGQHIEGIPVTHNGRSDCKRLDVPLEATGGTVITVSKPGYVTISARAVFGPNPDGPASLDIDDFTLQPAQTEPVPPQPESGPEPTAPLDRINAIYATGGFDLWLKEDCGKFTEAVCEDFALFYGPRGQLWGHIGKKQGQNQYNNHAVDAIQCLYGPDHGIWDIIVSSVSQSAKPAYNRAGDADPGLFRPYEPLPCAPAR